MKIIKTLSKFISAIGNPVVIALFYTFFIAFFNGEKQISVVWFALAVIIPLSIFIYYKVKTGDFSNYDVSHRIHRKKLYKYLLIILLALNILGYFMNFNFKFMLINFGFFTQILISFLINEKLKISMHASFSFLFSYLFYIENSTYGLILFFCCFLICLSRYILGRHSWLEIISGAFLGNIVGVILIFILKS